MKSILRFFLLLIFVGSQAIAQQMPVQPDPLSPVFSETDTIHLRKRRVFLTMVRQYDYRYAGNLTDRQLIPLLRQSPDSTVRVCLERGRGATTLFTSMYISGYALMVAAVFAPIRQPAATGSMALGGLGLFSGALIPLGARSKWLERAVEAHNRQLSSRADSGFLPPVSTPGREAGLSQADTVAVIRRGLSKRYTYRGIWVNPAWQLGRLAGRLNDADVRDGFQYNRRVTGVALLFTGLSAGYLVPQLLIYGILRTNGRSATLGSPVFWTATTAMAIGFGIGFHARRVQFQTVQILNERLHGQYNTTRYGEHFQNP